MKRMDRYNEETTTPKVSRSNRNKDLYENIGNNTRYTNITDVTNSNAIDITNTNKEYKTREDYQNMKKYSTDIPTPKVKKDLENFNNVYKHENRVYDINNVLEEARKNRQEDDLEEKRKLKNNSYNILANLSKEDLEKYREEKKNRMMHDDEELRELIDTIASNTLAGEIEAASDLLSDLMATSILDKVGRPEDAEEDDKVKLVIETEEITITPTDDELEENTDDSQNDEPVLKQEDLEKIIETIKEEKEEQDEVTITKEEPVEEIDEEKEEHKEDEIEIKEKTKKQEDFYTRSMDLSEEDFDLEEEFKDKNIPVFVKILILVVLVAAIAAVIYFMK